MIPYNAKELESYLNRWIETILEPTRNPAGSPPLRFVRTSRIVIVAHIHGTSPLEPFMEVRAASRELNNRWDDRGFLTALERAENTSGPGHITLFVRDPNVRINVGVDGQAIMADFVAGTAAQVLRMLVRQGKADIWENATLATTPTLEAERERARGMGLWPGEYE